MFSNNAWQAYTKIFDKVSDEQANRIVLDLSNSSVPWDEVRYYPEDFDFSSAPHQAIQPGTLLEVIVMEHGEIIATGLPNEP